MDRGGPYDYCQLSLSPILLNCHTELHACNSYGNCCTLQVVNFCAPADSIDGPERPVTGKPNLSDGSVPLCDVVIEGASRWDAIKTSMDICTFSV